MSAGASRQTFLDAAANKHISSAYLIICSRLSVAARLADDFLLRLFCANGGCGSCPACLKVKEGHVDILRLDAPKVDDIREAITFISEKPVDAAYKAIVIADADGMTTEAANSLLKTLEEPPEHSVLVLQARSSSGVLPTIASRCAAVHLAPDAKAHETIMQHLGVDDIRARILADVSGGYLSEAKRIHEDDAFWALRSELLDLTDRLMRQQGMAVNSHVQFFSKHEGSTRSETGENMRMLLSLMLSYCRDILVFAKTQNETLITNPDRSENIQAASQHFTSGAISNMIRIILNAEQIFSVPVNFSLAIQKMLFDILEELHQWKK